MIYSSGPDRRPVTVVRIATPADIVDAGRDPGVYRAGRSSGNVTLLCEYATGEPGRVLCDLAGMYADGMELSVEMDRILGAKEGG